MKILDLNGTIPGRGVHERVFLFISQLNLRCSAFMRPLIWIGISNIEKQSKYLHLTCNKKYLNSTAYIKKLNDSFFSHLDKTKTNECSYKNHILFFTRINFPI